MARAALGYSRDRLAAEANLSAETIRIYENAKARLHINHLAAIAWALQRAGVRFVKDADGEICVHPPTTLQKPQDPAETQ